MLKVTVNIKIELNYYYVSETEGAIRSQTSLCHVVANSDNPKHFKHTEDILPCVFVNMCVQVMVGENVTVICGPINGVYR